MGRSRQFTSTESDEFVLEVLRIDHGETFVVRALDGRYGGINTHWRMGRSEYCIGESCPIAVHKSGAIWKGYTGVEAFEARSQKWAPVVLEITEALELDLRGKWIRGGVWEVWRTPLNGRKKQPVRGKLLETLAPATLPRAFPIIHVLQSLYHTSEIDLSATNPMPERTRVRLSEGAPPPGTGSRKGEEDKPQSREEWEVSRRALVEAGLLPDQNGKRKA